jgi:Rrf2 family protein
MHLSKRCEYALRALIDIGIGRELGRPVLQASELARHERIPVKFLEQILLQLRAEGYLTSKRGKHGGYSLAKPLESVRMGDVVRLFEGYLAPIACASQVAYERCSCPDEAHCGLRLLMLDVRTAISDVLDRHTLADIVEVTMRKFRRDRVRLPFDRLLEMAHERALSTAVDRRVRRGARRVR